MNFDLNLLKNKNILIFRSSDDEKLKNCESDLKELMKNYDTKY